MSVKDAAAYLSEATEVSKLKSFMVFGGEPMLYPERAVAIFEKASRFRIPEIEMLTNGFWGKNKSNAETMARRLKTAGVNTLGVSIDAFHLSHIPIEYPRNAALASVDAGIERVTWNVTVVESIDAPNEHDTKTRQILETLKPLNIDAHIHKIIPVGRATQSLSQYFTKPNLEGPCETEPFTNDSLKNPTSVCIEPSGSVEICWHLSVGNAKQAPLSRILNEYDWRKNLITRIVLEEGPTGLLRFLSKGDASAIQQNHYVSKCHLCIEIGKHIGR